MCIRDRLVDYFNLRNEQRSDWSGKAKLKCTIRDFEEVKRAVDYLKDHSLNTIEDLDTAISNLNQTAAPLRTQLKPVSYTHLHRPRRFREKLGQVGMLQSLQLFLYQFRY